MMEIWPKKWDSSLWVLPFFKLGQLEAFQGDVLAPLGILQPVQNVCAFLLHLLLTSSDMNELFLFRTVWQWVPNWWAENDKVCNAEAMQLIKQRKTELYYNASSDYYSWILLHIMSACDLHLSFAIINQLLLLCFTILLLLFITLWLSIHNRHWVFIADTSMLLLT